MKLTTGILAIAITAGAAWAQNPDAIDNARSIAKSLQQKQANDTNQALDAAGVPAPAAKPAPGSPAPAVRPAIIPAAKPASAPAAKTASAPQAKAPSTSGQHNQLQRVNVVESADGVRVEIISNQAVTPRVSKLSSPARILVELPETALASAKNKVSFDSAGVKGVRMGMDGKNPPTTSVVVDLEKACTYELTPGPADKLVLTLHTQAVAKSNPAPAKAPAAAEKPQAKANNAAPAAKPASVKPAVAAKPAVETKPAVAKAADQPAAAKAVAPKAATTKIAAPKVAAKDDKVAAAEKAKPGADIAKKPSPKPEEKKWAMNGKRDPFFSPVVQQTGGAGCSTGKKCLEIGQINVRGVVKSDNGFIAVVTNNMNKAYFLRENDPVFNGYVVKITGDSVVFQETVQDKLGKTFTREVVKRIFTPAV